MSTAKDNIVLGAREFLLEFGASLRNVFSLNAYQILQIIVELADPTIPLPPHSDKRTEEEWRQLARENKSALENVLPKKQDASIDGSLI